MPSEKHLLNHMHDLLAYLNAKNVTTILCSSQHGFIGQSLTEPQPFPVSYLTDNLIFLRFFEAGGRMRRAIAVVKHRCGTHDHYIHDMAIVDGVGLQVGGPLAKFQGILTGTPTYLGPIEELIKMESE
jgi:circadian clock protein KaiC